MDRPRIPFSAEGGVMTDPTMVDEYERMVGRFPWRGVGRRVLREATDALGHPPRRLLDVACGPGHLLCALADASPVVELHGLDYSEGMLQAAALRLQKAGCAERVRLHHGSAYEIPFADGDFDAVVDTDALHGFEDLTTFFSEIVRVLSPGGVGMVHAWRRDVPWWLWRAAHVQTDWLHSRGSRLEGAGAVLDASYTAEEVREAFAGRPGATVETRTGLVELAITVRKLPIAS